MVAKQLLRAASFVVLVGSARAQPAPPPAQPDDEAASTAPGNTDAAPPAPNRRAPTGTFGIGVGYNTDDGFIGSAEVAQSDLFGTGLLLAEDAKISERWQRFELRFADPELLGSSYQLDATLYSDRRHYDQFWREGAGASVGLSQIIAPHLKAYAGYRLEHVTMEPDDLASPTAPTGSYNLAALRAGVDYSTLDQPFMATRGTRIGSMIEVADPSLGSDVTMIHTKTFAETHQAVGPMILHLGGSFETVSGDALPEGELLHFDGSSQIRGIAPNEFGPRDLDGRHLGGTMAFYGHTDLEVPVSRRLGLSAVGFVDGGGMFTGPVGELGASTGFGMVWRSPLGPIGAYWAWPSLHDPPKFVFGVGAPF
jgi:outer membrane protein insertion porin family